MKMKQIGWDTHLLIISALLILLLGTVVWGKIEFSSDAGYTAPVISGSDPLRKKVEITTGAAEWPDGKEVSVKIAALVGGLGIGQGTLAPVTILGQTYATWQGSPKEIGTKTTSGRWKYEGDTVTAVKRESIPSNNQQTTFDWSAEGSVKITPYVWQESVSIGGAIRWPFAIQGSFGTTGTWASSANHSTTRSAASGKKGTHTVNVIYYCYGCKAEGDTQEAIGGKAAHAVKTCSRDACGISYRECDTTAKALHSECEGCNTYRCDTSTGKTHEQKTCTSAYIGSTTLRYGCGQSYWRCASDASTHTDYNHCAEGHEYKLCVASNHTLQASCSRTNGSGNTCTVTGFRECTPHTHQFGSGSGSGSNTCTLCSGTGCSTCQSGGQTTNPSVNPNGNGTPLPNGGQSTTPPSNGGCTTTLVWCKKYYSSYHTQKCRTKVSSEYEHRTTCSGCSVQYWTCNTPSANDDKEKHRLRTCKRSVCLQQWRRCAYQPEQIGQSPYYTTSPRCQWMRDTSPALIYCSE